MHSRNRYKHTKPDFGELGEFYPSLKPHLIQRHHGSTGGRSPTFTLDFSNPEALRELTCAILARDFGIKLEIPLDKLIPAVPQRLNYVHWIEDLLSDGEAGAHPTGEEVTGIDIGTGASCIYPLLGTKLNGWRFLATEIDPEATGYAQRNVTRNGMGDKITVKQVPESVVLYGAIDPTHRYSFCMCNPPFFKDRGERDLGQSRSGHRPPPSTVATGSEGETVVEGGELGFVKRIVEDSLKLRNAVRWFTSMLGKKASLSLIQDELRKHQVPVVTTAEFVQGKTWRWAIAWSFDDRLKSKVAQLPCKRQRPIMLWASAAPQPTPESRDFRGVVEWLRAQLRELEIEYTTVHESEGVTTLSCRARRNTWSHQRRRRRLLERLRQHKAAAQGKDDSVQVDCTPTLDSSLTRGSGEPDIDTSTQLLSRTQTGQQWVSPDADMSRDKPAADPKADRSCGEAENEQTGGDQRLEETATSSVTSRPEAADKHSVGDELLSEARNMVEAKGNGSCSAPIPGLSGPSSNLPEVPELYKESPKQSTSSSEDPDSLAAVLKRELEELCVPCNAMFECTLTEEGCKLPQAKRTKGKGGKYGACQGVQLSFEWLRGDDKDSLHQITQYMKNKLQQDKLLL